MALRLCRGRHRLSRPEKVRYEKEETSWRRHCHLLTIERTYDSSNLLIVLVVAEYTCPLILGEMIYFEGYLSDGIW